MEFRYPKARLFAYNKLAGGDSCYSVMIQAVTDAGLISGDVAVRLNSEADHGATCGALHAAEKIIHEFMHENHDGNEAQDLSNTAFKQIKSEVECWKQSIKIAGNCEKSEPSDSCRDMTPVVLDLLLQQIMRH